ncbi:hypothetical protein KC335_g99 [Hortaea werneckii]|nr:hypothetical protein KC335_g99 [Hortaea werneckii]
MADTKAQQPERRDVDVAADGDIILALPQNLCIRVSSAVLSLVSPVFKAMLGPRFREGSESRSSSQPKEISLPEDDGIAMKHLCLLLHAQGTCYCCGQCWITAHLTLRNLLAYRSAFYVSNVPPPPPPPRGECDFRVNILAVPLEQQRSTARLKLHEEIVRMIPDGVYCKTCCKRVAALQNVPAVSHALSQRLGPTTWPPDFGTNSLRKILSMFLSAGDVSFETKAPCGHGIKAMLKGTTMSAKAIEIYDAVGLCLPGALKRHLRPQVVAAEQRHHAAKESAHGLDCVARG